MPTPQLIAQTTYAELLERCSAAAFSEAFPEDGTFVVKTVNARRYWYFQERAGEVRRQRYVGPETPELLEQIAHHRQARDDERERRALILSALARAGVFRLRSVLVGTVAYQTYSAMLGVRLPVSSLQTGDIDIAQFRNVSIAIEDRTPVMLDILKSVDETFRPVPHISDRRRVTSYIAKGGWRVDFLTPNVGPDTDQPQALPALQTDAQPPRFLDYLIHQPAPAVVLHHGGIHVHVPAPERYAIHKLIVSRRRPGHLAKRDKDLRQAEALLEVLLRRQPYELKLAWQEAYDRGQTWRQLLTEGVSLLPPKSRDGLLNLLKAAPV